ncbi:hypothetical protein [Pseudonocardia adelaidensis]|uniref:Uncharacterized protein n=1 Tax=Pseudonocardia adelaidensis TaxID=648754 RepID=A0ABP9NB74_9PSEU
MNSTTMPIPWSAHNGPAVEPTGKGRVGPGQRLAAVIWDGQLLPVQHAAYRVAPRFAAHLDELARRRDEQRRKRP